MWEAIVQELGGGLPAVVVCALGFSVLSLSGFVVKLLAKIDRKDEARLAEMKTSMEQMHAATTTLQTAMDFIRSAQK